MHFGGCNCGVTGGRYYPPSRVRSRLLGVYKEQQLYRYFTTLVVDVRGISDKDIPIDPELCQVQCVLSRFRKLPYLERAFRP
jgi:hypothetical protein